MLVKTKRRKCDKAVLSLKNMLSVKPISKTLDDRRIEENHGRCEKKYNGNNRFKNQSELNISSGLNKSSYAEMSSYLIKTTSSENSFITKHKKASQGTKQFCCHQCKKCFRRKSYFAMHMKIHGGEKKCCQECGKRFSVAGSLTRHMRTHTGEKPYCCQECEKRFSDASQLTMHMRIHT